MSSDLTQNREFKKIAKKFKKLKNTIIASFQANTSWEWPKMIETKKNRSDQFLPDLEQTITKKQKAQKFKKLIDTIMDSFQGKLRWERTRKNVNKKNRFNERTRKNVNKKNRSNEFLPDPEQGIP